MKTEKSESSGTSDRKIIKPKHFRRISPIEENSVLLQTSQQIS